MIKSNVTLSEAIAQFDRSSTNRFAEGYRSQRAEILKRFPLDKWPEMRLEDYALGQPEVKDTYCHWLEYKSRWVGGIGGGAAKKLIIYKRKDREGWYFPNGFLNEREAWDRLRSEFLQAFELAARGDWERIDELETLGRGPAVKLKSLHVYFPDQVLPVYSTAHLRRFLRLLDRPSEEVNASSVVALNRFLLAALRRKPAVKGWNTEELQRLLYNWRDPKETGRVLKIAPGESARFWEDCLREGYICVGWDAVGDLSQFESKAAFGARFEEAYPYNGHLAQARRKGNELWKLSELEPGDLVVANRGIGRVLALGEVVEPGYRWADERPEYRHTVAIKWDTTYEQSVAPQKRWATVTVATVPETLLSTIVRDRMVVDAVYGRIAAAIERKGQLILYGPPGTGKTYQARRFAVWWLLRQLGREGADAVLGDADRLREAERELSTSQVSSRAWWVVANPKEWSWDRLFGDGKVEYRYGRLKRNYPLVQRGDLVVGYQSTPDKRVVALARVSRELQSVGNNAPTIELEPVERLDQGLSYDELKQDAVLAQSEPMRFNNQGTLFALTETEAEHLLVQLAERHPQRAVLEQAADSGTTDSVGPLTRVTFHPSYTYEDFIEGFRPDAGGAGGAGGLLLALEDGVFKRVCRAAQANPGRPYLLLIDEINRGNVAKIMGELLTLLERDKRGLTLTLPQSKETFSVPPNVFLLGTMNTADRSIKLLDAALRRRFAFLECMPDSELLHGAAVGDLALDDFLDGLNQRIARFEGREKQVGHSYLLVDGQPVDEVEEFAARFREEILPLLQEYCYDEYATLAKFIGRELVDADAGTLDAEKVDDAEQLVAALAREFGDGGISAA